MYTYKYISTNTTTTMGKGGVFHSIVIGETAAGTITISDNKGTIAVLKASIAEGEYVFDCAYSGTLSVVTGAASKCTVLYN